MKRGRAILALLIAFLLIPWQALAGPSKSRTRKKPVATRSLKPAKNKKAKAKPVAKPVVEAERQIPAGYISLSNINTRERYKLVRMVSDGKLTADGREKLTRLLRDTRHKKQKKVPDRLLWEIYNAAQHFDRPVVIVSGYRSKDRKTSRHSHGHAADFRLEGIDPKAVWEHCQSRKKLGCGYYPKSGFVHFDVRDKDYTWIDNGGGPREHRAVAEGGRTRKDRGAPKGG